MLASCQFINVPAYNELSSIKTARIKTFKKIKLQRKNGHIVYRKTIDRSIPFIGADKVHQSNYTGSGTYIAVLDTGIDKTNPLIKDSVALEACFTTYNSCPNKTSQQFGPGAADPVDWHGSHVSGIAAGNVYDKYKGVAPDAKLIAVNVFDDDLSSSDEAIIKALTWVYFISPKYNIASVNLSLGTTKVFQGNCDSLSPQMTNIIHALYDANIAVVIAAGNAGSIGMSSPACISKVVSVAASDYSDGITYFSNISQNTTFAAPGATIGSAGYGNTIRYASGTSMAAPHVAGVFALYKQMYPNDTIDQAIARLQSISPTISDYSANIKVKRIDIDKLVNADPVVPTTTTTPPQTTTTTVITTTTTTPKYYSKPQLLEVRALRSYSTTFTIVYKDSLLDKSIVANYQLTCGYETYRIPLDRYSNYHTYIINDMPIFTSCAMRAKMINGDYAPYTFPVYLTIG